MSDWSYHGGQLADAKVHFEQPTASWLDLSTGINPHAWPGVADLPIDWQRLPDVRALEALEAAAADCFGVDPAYVCAVPGTEIGLRMLGDVLPGPAAYLDPSYRTHADVFQGARPLPMADFATAQDATILLANPNNPDGSVIPTGQLIDRLRTSQQWLVIDEAFADANPELSLVHHAGDALRLVVFRSFGKFFGLAGVRLGFVIGPRRVVACYRDRLGSWPVSAAALAIGAAAYRDRNWIVAMQRTLATEAAALDAVLRGRGYEPVGACPLFRLIETDGATDLFEHLARRAILTRPFDYNPRWLRIGLPGDGEALARLDEALTRG
ncbi:MAG: threonine-phosphate decarboxylase [Sphingomonadales bacterium]|nr:threonine-phosphate decarboxylase [Sphingomonadales bacterium]